VSLSDVSVGLQKWGDPEPASVLVVFTNIRKKGGPASKTVSGAPAPGSVEAYKVSIHLEKFIVMCW
jgi:hypothetical protein